MSQVKGEPMNDKFKNIYQQFFNSEKVGGLLLVICTIISLIIANSSSGDEYINFMHRKIDLSFSSVNLNFTIEHWVNDGFMAIFFLLVGLEIEREIYIGELASFRKALLPIAAAVGGMVVPALIHYLLNKGSETQPGFAIPMATDIAFALGILSLAGSKVPTAVKIFLTALAIIDDIGAIIIIALFYTKTILFAYLIAALLIFGGLLVLNRQRVNNLLLYLLPGIVMWYCFLQSGVHATIAGVLLAVAIPFHKDNDRNLSYQLQEALHKPVAFIIVPLFALVNTAIKLPEHFFSALSGSNSIGIITGLLFGKLTGIFLFPYLLIKTRIATGDNITRTHLVGVGLLGGIGFTMSIFICNLAFTDSDLIATSKLSVLVGSALAALCGLLVFMLGNNKRNVS